MMRFLRCRRSNHLRLLLMLLVVLLLSRLEVRLLRLLLSGTTGGGPCEPFTRVGDRRCRRSNVALLLDVGFFLAASAVSLLGGAEGFGILQHFAELVWPDLEASSGSEFGCVLCAGVPGSSVHCCRNSPPFTRRTHSLRSRSHNQSTNATASSRAIPSCPSAHSETNPTIALL